MSTELDTELSTDPSVAPNSAQSDGDVPTLSWSSDQGAGSALWRSQAGLAPPQRVLVADDTISADAAYRLACSGGALLWRGDFQNARQLLQALARRIDKKSAKASPAAALAKLSTAEVFHRQRMAQAQRSRILSCLLILVGRDHHIGLRRAPDVREACREVYGEAAGESNSVVSLRELQGVIGAHEWRKKGVPIAALGASIHPHYGVFSPVRGEYVDLVAQAPLPAGLSVSAGAPAFDIGTGSGVLAAVLARRGVARIVATDREPRALACASDNFIRLGYAERIELLAADLFPPGRAPLVVCNPPWVPGRASSPLEHAVYDPESRMLRGFLTGLAAHLEDAGEGWLILSDLAEHLTLRSRAELLAGIDAAGLKVLGRIDTRPTHARVSDISDPLHLARAAEVTSLWRLAKKTSL